MGRCLRLATTDNGLARAEGYEAGVEDAAVVMGTTPEQLRWWIAYRRVWLDGQADRAYTVRVTCEGATLWAR